MRFIDSFIDLYDNMSFLNFEKIAIYLQGGGMENLLKF